MTKKGFLKLSYDVKGNDLDLTCDVKGNDNDNRKWLTTTVKNRRIPKYVITFEYFRTYDVIGNKK